MTCRQLSQKKRENVSQKKRANHSLCICYLNVLGGQVSSWSLCCTPRGVCVNSSFFEYFDGLEKSTFNELWENLHNRFFSFYQNQLFRYVCLSVPNCSLVEDILDTLCIAQILCDHSILRVFTVMKWWGHTNFNLSKINEGHFQLICNLV